MTVSSAADQAWQDADQRAGLRGARLWGGPAVRVVSTPCVEWFTAQEPSYQEEVLPVTARARACVAAGAALGWRACAGGSGESAGPEHSGASAGYGVLLENFGFTAKRLPDAARRSLARAAGGRQAESVRIDKER